MLFSDPDVNLKTCHLMLGKMMSDDYTPADAYDLYTMAYFCKARGIHPIKHPNYRWSNSGSENKAENTLFKRPTYWLYHKILKHVGLDPLKGASIDQLRAWWLICYAFKDRKAVFYNLIGFVLRLGFAPSLMENILFKPQHLLLPLSTLFKPLGWLVYPFYVLGRERNLKIGVWDNTTNKISLLPTMWLMGYKFHYPKSMFFIKSVYTTYYCQEDNKHVGAALIKGFTRVLKENIKS